MTDRAAISIGGVRCLALLIAAAVLVAVPYLIIAVAKWVSA